MPSVSYAWIMKTFILFFALSATAYGWEQPKPPALTWKAPDPPTYQEQLQRRINTAVILEFQARDRAALQAGQRASDRAFRGRSSR